MVTIITTYRSAPRKNSVNMMERSSFFGYCFPEIALRYLIYRGKWFMITMI